LADRPSNKTNIFFLRIFLHFVVTNYNVVVFEKMAAN